MFSLRYKVPDAELQQAVFSFGNDKKVFKNIDSFQQNIFSVRDNLFPVLNARLCHRRFHQSEIQGIFVGHDQEFVVLVINVVKYVLHSGLENLKAAFRLVSIQNAGIPTTSWQKTR
jgi:hypothetical protein